MRNKERKTRNRNKPDEDRMNLLKHHKVSARHVLVLEADISENDKRHVFHLAEKLRKASNQVVNTMNKRLDQMNRSKEYRTTKTAYIKTSQSLANIQDENSLKYKTLM